MEKFEAPKDPEKKPDEESVPEAPEGWKTMSDLLIECGVDFKTLSEITAVYKKNDPEGYKDFKNKKGNVFKHFSPGIVSLVKEKLAHKKRPKESVGKHETVKGVPSAPAGWMNSVTLSDELFVDRKELMDFVAPYFKFYPHYFVQYKDEKGKVREHYAPELVSMIIRDFEKTRAGEEVVIGKELETDILEERVPEPITDEVISIQDLPKESSMDTGEEPIKTPEVEMENVAPPLKLIEERRWITSAGLAVKLGASRDRVLQIAEKYRKSNPEYFRMIRTTKTFEHYSKELAELIEQEVKKIMEFPGIPEGEIWVTNNAIAEEFQVTAHMVSEYAKQYRETHPEGFRALRGRQGHIFEHYSETVAELIRSDIRKFMETPAFPEGEGWESRRALEHQFGVSDDLIKSTAKKYREHFPHYFRFFRKNNLISEYYSKELVVLMKSDIERFKNTPKAPTGWQPLRSLGGLGLSQRTLRRYIAPYLNDPEYVQIYKDERGTLCQHCSPKLIEIIREKIKKEK